ncbi:uncharacterized protein B0H18DRAFT_1117921 [Fomitopsis serialis]|uniref:uncharacterized protein n=1 Tax=Fomitopsis serialis TaxID=139415 RepID=UPI00200761B8|nr:uncharacterized protein B0H18DRAFT_1117921 [Neoantrodia serialis]KAH9928738.1 hypothetical protein B0H18DRAFT_1117921 [Neoantrodia serialis]
MFTRFVNPHSLDAKVEIVSRAQSLQAIQNRLVKRSLGDLGTSEDADEKARRKRRKTEKKHANDAQEESTNSLTSIPFRLVSRTLPPKEIELKPKEAPVIVVREPPCEDNEDEAARRGARAQEVAVHFAQIIHEAQRLSTSHRVEARGAIHMKGKVSSPPPPVMVVEWDKPPPKTPKLASARPFVELRPSPHTLGPKSMFQ